MANSIFDDLIKDVEKLIKKRERGVKEDYKAAYRRLRNKLQKLYADYESEDDGVKLTRDELRKLDVDTAKIMAEMYKGNETAVQNTLESVLNASYKTVNTITSKYNIEAVARKIDANNIIKKQVAGHIWTDRIKKYGNDFVYDVHGIIHQGLDNGDTYTTTARKLKERFGKDIGNTMRIARTESARVLEDSKYQAFEDLASNENVKVFKIWHTMGDEAVRDTHDAMEGVKVLYDEDFILPSGARCQYPKGTGVAAEDINCRCYVEYVTELVKDDKSLEKIAKIGYNEYEEENKKEDDTQLSDKNLGKLNKALDKEIFNEFVGILNDHENEAIKTLYRKYGDQLDNVSYDKSARFLPNENALYVNITDKELYPDKNKFATIAHEFGHVFDFKSDISLPHSELEAVRDIVGKTLAPDSTLSSSDTFIEAARKDKKALLEQGFDVLKKAMIDDDASAGVQDAIDGFFIGPSHRIGWGHGEKYYNRKYEKIKEYSEIFGDDYETKLLNMYKEKGLDVKKEKDVKSLIRDYDTAVEMWANIASAETTGGKELEYVKKYLPNAHEAFLKIIKEIK